jgi:hypothetical protein
MITAKMNMKKSLQTGSRIRAAEIRLTRGKSEENLKEREGRAEGICLGIELGRNLEAGLGEGGLASLAEVA